MKKIYFISGLGADHRVFKNLELPNFESVHIAWLTPFQNETIGAYAKRLSELIEDQDPILIGMSLGGIIAIEISKHIPSSKIILISSVKCAAELPVLYRLGGQLAITKNIPISLFKTVNEFSFWLFGIKGKEEKKLFRQIVKDADNTFYRWAINTITVWKNKEYPENLIHIHGDKDKVLYLPRKVNYVIKGAGHFMVYNRAKELSKIILSVLSNPIIPNSSINLVNKI